MGDEDYDAEAAIPSQPRHSTRRRTATRAMTEIESLKQTGAVAGGDDESEDANESLNKLVQSLNKTAKSELAAKAGRTCEGARDFPLPTGPPKVMIAQQGPMHRDEEVML